MSGHSRTPWIGKQTRYTTYSGTNIRSFDDNPCHPPSLKWITALVFHSFFQTQIISFISASCRTGNNSVRSASSFCVNPAYPVFPFLVFPFTDPRCQQGVSHTPDPHISNLVFTCCRTNFIYLTKNNVFLDRLLKTRCRCCRQCERTDGSDAENASRKRWLSVGSTARFSVRNFALYVHGDTYTSTE